MMKTLTLSLAVMLTMTIKAFAHTGVSEYQGGLLHDFQHLFMGHDGTMTAGMVVAFLATAGVWTSLTLLRKRSKS